MQKNEIRAMISSRRRALTKEWIDKHSTIVQEKICHLQRFEDAAVVCCYLEKQGEVNTDMVIKRCLETNKKLAVPAWDPELEKYDIVNMDENTKLKDGHFHVREPVDRVLIDFKDVDIMIVPGLAFAPSLGRVGHGGGYYDRMLLKTRDDCLKVALAFDFQMLETVPETEHDVKMDMVCCST